VVTFGRYTTIISLGAVVAQVTDAGMSNIGTREYAIARGAAREALLRDLLGLRVALTLLGAVLTTGVAVLIGYNGVLVAGALTAGLSMVGLIMQHTLTIPLLAELRLGVVSGLELVRQVLWVAGIVVLAALGANVFAMLSVPFVVNLVLIPATAVFVRGRISMRVSFSPSRWPPLLRAAVVFSLATAVGQMYIYAGQILTSIVATPHEAGIFAVSFRIAAVIAQIPSLLAAAALPVLARAARDDRDRLQYALQRIFEVGLIGGLGLAVVMSAASGFIIAVVAGPTYREAASVLSLQVFALVASFVLAGWSFALLSLRLHRGLLAANLASLAVLSVATIVLASRYGATGAAVAMLLGELTLALSTLTALIRGRQQYRPHLGVVPRVVVVAVAALVAGAVPAMPSIVRGVVATVVYVAGLFITRSAPPELVHLLPSRRA
jgi:PST family polysaccharide transporter